MKKGFMFTIIFSLFFLMLLYAAIEYLNVLQARQAELGNDEPGREACIADDIANDYLSLFGMRTGVSRKGNIYWTVEDKPGVWDTSARIDSYERFVSAEFSESANADAKVVLDRSGTLVLDSQEITYARSGGTGFFVKGPALEYRFTARISESCGTCIASGAWAWGEAGSGPFVSLDVRDSNGTAVSFPGQSSGYVMANQTNFLSVPLSSGKLFEIRLAQERFEVETGSGAETRIVVGVNEDAGMDTTTEARVYAPIDLTLGKRVFTRIPIVEK